MLNEMSKPKSRTTSNLYRKPLSPSMLEPTKTTRRPHLNNFKGSSVGLRLRLAPGGCRYETALPY